MRKLYFFFVVMMLALAQSLQATQFSFVKGENKTDHVKDFIVSGTYTVDLAGKVLIYTPQEMTVSLGGEAVEGKYAPGSVLNPYYYELECETGDVITIRTTSFLNAGAPIWIVENGKGPIKISLENVTPEAEQKFNWDRAGQVTLNFNRAITMSTITLVTKGGSFPVEDDIQVSTSISCNITNAYNKAFDQGALKAGDPFYVRIDGVADATDKNNKYPGTTLGRVQVKYTATEKQSQLVKTSVNGQELVLGDNTTTYAIKSYYDTDAEDGLFVFEFDKNVKSVSYAKLQMGNLDKALEGLYFESMLEPKVEGNKVYVDLRGELRTYARMFPAADLPSSGVLEDEDQVALFTNMSLGLINVIDENDIPVASPGIGTVASFYYTFGYVEIEDRMNYEGNRGEDAIYLPKNAGDEIQVWVEQELKPEMSARIFFKVIDAGQGVDEEGNPAYADFYKDVPAENIKVLSVDPTYGTELSFIVPDLNGIITEEEGELEAAEGTPIRVVVQVKGTNGMPHDLILNYFYKWTPTGVEEINENVNENVNDNENIYDLSGRKVKDSNKAGIYIVNGKKVIK